MLEAPSLPILLGALVAAHLAGLVTAGWALMTTRTPQGSVAWLLSLLFAPWIAVPAYWVFGRSRFEGYVSARRGRDARIRRQIGPHMARIVEARTRLPDERGGIVAAERLAELPILGGNRVEPLLDGEATFRSLFEGLDRARDTVVVQFYILRDDRLGMEFQERLLACARRGVRVYLLVDRVGSYGLPDAYLETLRKGGVEAQVFLSSRGFLTRFQVNFRNHRKVMVVDGREGWLGGLNVGVEYLGEDPDIGHWRDTHLRIEGPAALALQLTFVEDWFWVTEDVPELPWSPERPEGLSEEEGEPVLVVPTGPADREETASLLMQHAIHSATRRIWISSPYFVPDSAVMAALKLAALRGVDVRVLIPKHGDAWIMDLAGFAFYLGLLDAGVRIFRFRHGFLHCKTFLVDDVAAAVGTANLDNRSLRLNFELTALLFGPDGIGGVEAHFDSDFEVSEELTPGMVENLPLHRRILSRVVYLFAPIL
jgi:cardiolipin synthase A/B